MHVDGVSEQDQLLALRGADGEEGQQFNHADKSQHHAQGGDDKRRYGTADPQTARCLIGPCALMIPARPAGAKITMAMNKTPT